MRGGQPPGLAVELGAVVAAVQVDRELAGLGQLVVEGDAGALPGAAADRRAGEAAAEGPELRFAAGEDLLLGLPNRDVDVVALEDRRDRQPLAEGSGGERRRRRLGRDRQQPAAPAPQGQEDGEGAAAKGAEESPAPEAVCI